MGLKRSLYTNLAAGALVGIFCLQAILAVPRLSATCDERVHLASGYSYWRTRDFRMNREHPPLAKLLAAVPLLYLHPRFDTTSGTWKAADEINFGDEFVYGNDADRLLFWARLSMILIAAIGAVATFLWARDLFGPLAGLFALTLYAFCPDLLAHGMLVTTDVPLAAFTTLTLYVFWKRGKDPSWNSDLITGVSLGLAMVVKFSGAMLPLIIIVFCLIRKQFKSLFIIGASSFLVVQASYLFSASPLLYFYNVRFVNANHAKDYPIFLLGELKPGGWWYYFPVAFLVKATLPVVLLVLLASVWIAMRGFIDRWGEMILLVTVLMFIVAATIGAVQIGVRYILPVFPLLYIWVSRIVPDFTNKRWGIPVLAALLAWHAWSSISVFPNYIPYFNELAGGPARGPEILDDSNIDWGQGLKQAADYIRKEHLALGNTYFVDSFSGRGPEYYRLPGNLSSSREGLDRLVTKVPSPGTYILSSHFVTRISHIYMHWQAYKPIDRIGESLWVYKF